MSSVASKHALLIALGGFSIAALFVWYIKKSDKEGRKKKKLNDVITNGTTPTESRVQNGHAQSAKLDEPHKDDVQDEEHETIEYPVEKDSEEETVVDLPSDEDFAACGDSGVHEEEHDESPQKEEIHILPAGFRQKEIEIGEDSKVIEISDQGRDVEEEFVKKEEIKLKSAPVPLITMPSKKKVLEHEQIPEEPTPTKVLDTPLSLDISAQMSPAAFSWSEEMEKEDEFRLNESSDIDRSPASPRHVQQQQNNRKGQNKNRKGRNQPEKPLKKGQRRLVKEKSVEEPAKQESAKQKKVVVSQHEAGDAVHEQIIEAPHPEAEAYEKSESPGLDSQNSEASSQDSGRATGGLASSLSPHDEGLTGADDDFMPMYEFEIPNTLVGLIIGVKGKTIKELSLRTNVRMLIRQHHANDKVKTHQICQVRGKRDEINHCLQMLRRRFPPARFPELNLQPVVPPVMPNNNFDMLSTQPTWLTLPEEIKCEVAVSAIISPSHFFLQQPTHPSFASLRGLGMYMDSLYGEQSNLPELPIPCQNGLLCAAPIGNAWYRAVTVNYFEDTDEVFVKFVDYGGYSKMARQDLRQIRTDLMSLPFQSTEVILAHVRPVDGTNNWSEAALLKFKEFCTGKVINSKLVGWAADTSIPMVELFVMNKGEDGESREIRFDQILMEEGLARTADPTKMIRPSHSQPISAIKRPSLASQTSQTTVVC